MHKFKIGSTEVILKQGDITLEKTDAIVNAANEHLMHGGGLAAAIARKAGSDLIKESKQIGHVPTGSAEATTGGNLAAKYVIHAVGPIWRGGTKNEKELLASAVKSSLVKATDLKLRSISLPAISTGIFGYPIEEAAKVILQSTIDFIQANPDSLDLVQFVLFSDHDYEVFSNTLREVQGIPESSV
ncbi:MAG: macro domain-containing protein [Methanobacteriota archaeon]|nr:MAG: macro domain-containing protein [Euryarchaeota archaeon]